MKWLMRHTKRFDRSILFLALIEGLVSLVPASLAARSRVVAGNQHYRVAVADGGSDSTDQFAGMFTAWTGLRHPVTARLGQLGSLGTSDVGPDGVPAFSHFSLRSLGSATDYLFGSNLGFLSMAEPGFECVAVNDLGVPHVEQVFVGGEARGVRASWSVVNGSDDFNVELLLLVHGEAMMDGSIELSINVHDWAVEPLVLGVRVVRALRHSGMGSDIAATRFAAVRSFDNPEEPLADTELTWEAGEGRAWEAWFATDTPYSEPFNALYAIAGTIEGPETLIPAPTPPDRIQWAFMNQSGGPVTGLADACFDWEVPDPPRHTTPQMALVFYWGHDEAHAVTVPPGGEVTFTQYMMGYHFYPLVAIPGGPYEAPCEGAVTAVPVRGLAETRHDRLLAPELHYRWSCADPRVSFEDPAAQDTLALVTEPGTYPIEMVVFVGPYEVRVQDTITVTDTEGPRFTSLTVEPGSLWPPNHRLEEVRIQWEVEDDCDASPTVRLVSARSSEPERRLPGLGAGSTNADIVSADLGTADELILLRAERGGTGEGRVYTLTYEVEDGSGNVGLASVDVRVEHDRRSRLLRPRP